MNQEQLNRMHKEKGFIAALDQSGGSTPKALAQYGIEKDAYTNDEEMFTLVHQMRSRIITSPAFNANKILAAILFENTMDRQIEGVDTADYLWNKKGIIPILKVDQGLAPLHNGVQLMKPISNLDALLTRAGEKHIFGTKMRSVIMEANEIGIQEIVKQQFELATQIAKAGFVPIIEPEVNISIADKRQAENILLKEIERHLKTMNHDLKVMFKLTIPSKDNLYSELMKYPNVVRVVALSGGYARDEADEKLKHNLGMIASFSRALLDGLTAQQSEAEFNQQLQTAIDKIYDASINKR